MKMAVGGGGVFGMSKGKITHQESVLIAFSSPSLWVQWKAAADWD